MFAPRWMSKMDRRNFAPRCAFLLQPWALIAASAATAADLSERTSMLAMVVFCLLATLGHLVMKVFAIVAPEATRSQLKSLRDWLDAHRDPTVVALSLIIGVGLIAESFYLVAV